MAVNINEFKLFTEYVSNKVQSGNSTTIPQFNELCHRAQMQVFEKDRETFIATGVASNFLQSFLTLLTQQVNPVLGTIPYPTDYEHTSAARSYYNGNEYPIDLIENTKWGDVLISALNPPTLRFPKYAQFGNEYRFAPKNIGTVFIDYFRTPLRPIWAYTVVNNRPVYDSANSIDFEWDEFAFNNVAAMFLSLNGVNLKDTELAQFSQMYKQETNSVL